jgi:TrbL/VirB6 plasmid conjugal transfer protein
MENFAVLGSLTWRIHQDFVQLYFVMLPAFFALALAIDWFRHPQGSPDFLETLKRAIVATLLVVGFQEISNAILALTSGIADRISDLSGLDSYFQMAGEKARSYPKSAFSLVLGFDDFFLGLLTFISYIAVYIARYINIALYHFMWIFLTITGPVLMLFHLFRGTAQIPVNVFKSMIEVASYKIVWAVLSAMITSLAFGQAMAADGNYLTVVLLNFVVALAMLGTPLIVKSLVGGGLSTMSETFGAGAVMAIVAAPSRAKVVLEMGREVLSNTKGFANHMGGLAGSKMLNGINTNATPLVPPGLPPMPEPLPPSHQLSAPPLYMHAPDGYFGADSTKKSK